MGGRRQIAGDDGGRVGEPAVGLQRVDHAGDLCGRYRFASKARIVRMVRQHDGRHGDRLVAEGMQRRDGGGEADRSEDNV